MTDRDLTKITELRFILLVQDLEKQKAFYEETFKWPVVEDWGRGILYDTGSGILELIQDNPSGQHNGARIALAVKDVWNLFEELKGKVKLEFPLRKNSWGDTSFRIIDPEGFPITFFTIDK